MITDAQSTLSSFSFDSAPPPELSSQPSDSDQAPASKPAHIPRPQNMFMIYRKEMLSKDIPEIQAAYNSAAKSGVISKMWQSEPPEVKAEYGRKAAEEKARHAEKYPGYKYQPRPRAAKGKAGCPQPKDSAVYTPKEKVRAREASSPYAVAMASREQFHHNGRVTKGLDCQYEENQRHLERARVRRREHSEYASMHYGEGGPGSQPALFGTPIRMSVLVSFLLSSIFLSTH